jgi:hypothetical protein
MTPSILTLAAIALISAVVAFVVRRGLHSADALDLGVVSTRWLSDLRRDDPWTRP